MERYAIEAQARADELLDLLTDGQVDLLREWLRDNLDNELIDFILSHPPCVAKILPQTPAKDQQWAT